MDGPSEMGPARTLRTAAAAARMASTPATSIGPIIASLCEKKPAARDVGRRGSDVEARRGGVARQARELSCSAPQALDTCRGASGDLGQVPVARAEGRDGSAGRGLADEDAEARGRGLGRGPRGHGTEAGGASECPRLRPRGQSSVGHWIRTCPSASGGAEELTCGAVLARTAWTVRGADGRWCARSWSS